MVDRIRYNTVSYLPFYYVFFQFLLLTIFNLQANILTTKDILSNLAQDRIVLCATMQQSALWRNGSASDSRSEGWVFESLRGQ